MGGWETGPYLGCGLRIYWTDRAGSLAFEYPDVIANSKPILCGALHRSYLLSKNNCGTLGAAAGATELLILTLLLMVTPTPQEQQRQ